jgi:hypothetical protein
MGKSKCPIRDQIEMKVLAGQNLALPKHQPTTMATALEIISSGTADHRATVAAMKLRPKSKRFNRLPATQTNDGKVLARNPSFWSICPAPAQRCRVASQT